MTISREESRRRVAFAAFAPAVRLAMSWSLPLREAKQMVELAYYAEGRRRKLKMRELTEMLSVSMSKLGLLSKDLKGLFDLPEAEQELSRRILSVLWAGPLTEARVANVFEEHPADEVAQTLRHMVEQRLIEVVPGRTPVFRLAEARYRLAREPWMARYDALRNLMHAVAMAIEARFEHADDRAFVRTLSFRVRPEDLEQLRELYEAQILQTVTRLDELASRDGTDRSIPMNLVTFWTPDLDAALDEARRKTTQGDAP
jgi:hypothetical protein